MIFKHLYSRPLFFRSLTAFAVLFAVSFGVSFLFYPAIGLFILWILTVLYEILVLNFSGKQTSIQRQTPRILELGEKNKILIKIKNDNK